MDGATAPAKVRTEVRDRTTVAETPPTAAVAA